ncbi:MAG TPA: NADH-quinone oxidoreductase subunit NuoE [Beijerinckiaceae bacterium]|jgi:NADH-quinone oxidoreductase subunit E|nr:NADH-quinone oxidoreductase subunit NuoE [Beijerinckiaceae bacterium]
MSVRRLAELQPEAFDFTPENRAWADKQIQKYPPGRQASAIIPLLWQAQKQNGYWLPKPAIEKVAEQLGMPLIRALEIATFYTMFNLEPVGKFYIQMCGTTPCVLQGSDAIKAVLARRIGPPHKVTADGLFSWTEVECLGACCNAPMVQINDDYYEDLTPQNFEKLLDDLAAGRPVKTGSQIGRVTSEPVGGLTSLTEFWGKDGRSGPGRLPEEGGQPDHAAAAGEKAAQDAQPGLHAPAHEQVSRDREQRKGKPTDSIADTGTRTERPVQGEGKRADDHANANTNPVTSGAASASGQRMPHQGAGTGSASQKGVSQMSSPEQANASQEQTNESGVKQTAGVPADKAADAAPGEATSGDARGKDMP